MKKNSSQSPIFTPDASQGERAPEAMQTQAGIDALRGRRAPNQNLAFAGYRGVAGVQLIGSLGSVTGQADSKSHESPGVELHEVGRVSAGVRKGRQHLSGTGYPSGF